MTTKSVRIRIRVGISLRIELVQKTSAPACSTKSSRLKTNTRE